MKFIRRILFTVVFLVATGTMLYSGFQIVSVMSDRQESSNINEKLQEQAVTAVEKPNLIVNNQKDHGQAEDTEMSDATEPVAEIKPAANGEKLTVILAVMAVVAVTAVMLVVLKKKK